MHRVHKTVYRCVECNHAITNQRNFTVHRCEKYMEKSPLTLLCRKNCGKILRNEYNHEEHESACINRCITDAQLQDHIQRNHSDQPTFSCSKCPNVYGSNDKLLSHIQMCHSDIFK